MDPCQVGTIHVDGMGWCVPWKRLWCVVLSWHLTHSAPQLWQVNSAFLRPQHARGDEAVREVRTQGNVHVVPFEHLGVVLLMVLP